MNISYSICIDEALHYKKLTQETSCHSADNWVNVTRAKTHIKPDRGNQHDSFLKIIWRMYFAATKSTSAI